jgi:hypothetical protein
MTSDAVPQVRFGDWINEGWNMFVAQWRGWVIMSLGLFCVVALPIIVLVFFMYAAMIASAVGARGGGADASPFVALTFFGGIFLIVLITLPISVLLIGGMYRAAFKQLRGGRVQFSDLFSTRDCYWKLLGATILHGLLITVASFFCVIPGWIVGGLLFFAVPLVVERNLGPVEALQLSVEVTKKNWVMFTLFALLVQIIASLGSVLCYIGLLASWPLLFTMTAAAYKDTLGLAGMPPVPSSAVWQAPEYPPPPVNPPQPSTRLCPNCQASLPLEAQFCFRCGAQAPRQG